MIYQVYWIQQIHWCCVASIRKHLLSFGATGSSQNTVVRAEDDCRIRLNTEALRELCALGVEGGALHARESGRDESSR